MSQSPNGNPFPRSRNRFPLDATAIPDNDNAIPDNDNRFPLNDNAFPDNDNDRSAEFLVSGHLIPANREEIADRVGEEFSTKRLFLRGKRGHEFRYLGGIRQIL